MKIENISTNNVEFLNQDIPASHSASQLPFEPTVQAMGTWHDELPIIDTLQACKLALDAFGSLYATELKGKLRYQLIEKFRPCPFELLNSSEDKFSGTRHSPCDTVSWTCIIKISSNL